MVDLASGRYLVASQLTNRQEKTGKARKHDAYTESLKRSLAESQVTVIIFGNLTSWLKKVCNILRHRLKVNTNSKQTNVLCIYNMHA